jgi:hypothetical protein
MEANVDYSDIAVLVEPTGIPSVAPVANNIQVYDITTISKKFPN